MTGARLAMIDGSRISFKAVILGVLTDIVGSARWRS
jgi:hypothetical protein